MGTARATHPRFTAIGPGEHHLAVCGALPSVDASHVALAASDDVERDGERWSTDATLEGDDEGSVALARAIGALLETCDVSYLCVERSEARAMTEGGRMRLARRGARASERATDGRTTRETTMR